MNAPDAPNKAVDHGRAAIAGFIAGIESARVMLAEPGPITRRAELNSPSYYVRARASARVR